MNIVFYTILAAVIISQLGEDPLALFFSFSSILLAFAFAFGKSASKYFDGCLFILVQRPFGGSNPSQCLCVVLAVPSSQVS